MELVRMMLFGWWERIGASRIGGIPKLVISEAGNFPELARFYVAEVVEPAQAATVAIVKRGIARGEFRKIDLQHAARLCVAPLLVIVLWRTTFARFDAEPYDYQGLIDAHLATLLKGLEAP